jgi:hypothetical protein
VYSGKHGWLRRREPDSGREGGEAYVGSLDERGSLRVSGGEAVEEVLVLPGGPA